MNPNAKTVAPQDIKPFRWDADLHNAFLLSSKAFEDEDSFVPKDAIALLKQEKEGIFYAETATPLPHTTDRAEQEAISNGRKKCPHCVGGITRRLCSGKETGVRVEWPVPCRCAAYKRYFTRWNNPRMNGKNFQDATMSNLLNGKLRDRFPYLTDDSYNTIVAVMREFPFYSALLVGSKGVGKTTLMAAIFDRSLRAWAEHSFKYGLHTEAIWKSTARELADEHIEWATRDPEGPEVTRPMVTAPMLDIALKREYGFTPLLAIDEFDKYKMSDDNGFQNRVMHSLINKCWEGEGQVVATANIKQEWLAERLGPQFDGMLRRMMDTPKGMYINFHTGKVYVNLVRHVLKDGKLVAVPKDRIVIPDQSGQGVGNSGGYTAPAQQPSTSPSSTSHTDNATSNQAMPVGGPVDKSKRNRAGAFR